MVRKLTYVAPAVIRQVSMELETRILTGSVVNNSSTIETTGQQTESYNFADHTTFNSGWE